MATMKTSEAATGGGLKKSIFKNFAIFTRKDLYCSVFLIKFQAWRPANLLKRDSSTGFFSCEDIAILLRTPIEQVFTHFVCLLYFNSFFIFMMPAFSGYIIHLLLISGWCSANRWAGFKMNLQKWI